MGSGEEYLAQLYNIKVGDYNVEGATRRLAFVAGFLPASTKDSSITASSMVIVDPVQQQVVNRTLVGLQDNVITTGRAVALGEILDGNRQSIHIAAVVGTGNCVTCSMLGIVDLSTPLHPVVIYLGRRRLFAGR
jgi:hypothetical protein